MDIKYPIECINARQKTAFLYRLQEKLRLIHNFMGKKYRDGEITEVQWNAFLVKWNQRCNLLTSHLLQHRDSLKGDDTWNIDLDIIFEE